MIPFDMWINVHQQISSDKAFMIYKGKGRLY